MKFAILSILFLSTAAQAQNFLVPFGQNAQLTDGDVAFVQSGNFTSVVSCGGQQLPTYFDYVRREVSNSILNADDFAERPNCEKGYSNEARDLEKRLIRDAKNDCLRSYTSCKQIGETEFVYVEKARNNGRAGCFVKIVVRGST